MIMRRSGTFQAKQDIQFGVRLINAPPSVTLWTAIWSTATKSVKTAWNSPGITLTLRGDVGVAGKVWVYIVDGGTMRLVGGWPLAPVDGAIYAIDLSTGGLQEVENGVIPPYRLPPPTPIAPKKGPLVPLVIAGLILWAISRH